MRTASPPARRRAGSPRRGPAIRRGGRGQAGRVDRARRLRRQRRYPSRRVYRQDHCNQSFSGAAAGCYNALMTFPISLPDWLPWWVPFAVLVPALLYLLVFLLMPFSVFGLKGRLEAIEERLDEIQGEIRTLVLRMPEPRGGASCGPIRRRRSPPVPRVDEDRRRGRRSRPPRCSRRAGRRSEPGYRPRPTPSRPPASGEEGEPRRGRANRRGRPAGGR